MIEQVSDHYRLRGRHVLLGITAGVAAYKAAELARLLTKTGAQVRVVMTPSAHEFIGAQTLQAITGEPVRDAIFDPEHEAAMGHIELARWAEVILVAPATADFLAKLRAGSAGTLLHTLCLASEAPLAVAPAMNEKMWLDQATQTNVKALRQRGVHVFGPAAGEQACGDVGPGRMQEPRELMISLEELFGRGRFFGRKVLLTAGPTREPLDAVRFLGNRSSGKMGYAIAAALVREGADLTLVSGPVALTAPLGTQLVNVETAQQMHDAVMYSLSGVDLFIACAAVADYRPAEVAEQKIKKTADSLNVQLVKNPDILRSVAALPVRPFCVGFAAETENLETYAEAKRRDKGIEMIAANQVGVRQGFESDDNALLVLWEGGRSLLPNQPKSSLAEQLVSLIADRIDAQITIENTG